MTQIRLIAGEHPDSLIERAKAEHRPIATICLFSGGDDSTVLAYRTREHYDSLAFIDTTTAVPGVIEHVQMVAADLDKPLRILRPEGDAYAAMVLGLTEDRSRM